MNKKISIALAAVLLMGALPIKTLGAGPLFSYDLYADTHPNEVPNAAPPASPVSSAPALSERNFEARVSAVNSEMENMDKQLKSLEKIMKINRDIQSVNSDNSLTPDQKLAKLKGYNNELKNILETDYKDQQNSPDFETAKKVLDTNDRMFSVLEDKNMSDAEKATKMQSFQNEFISLLSEYNGGGNSSASSGGSRNAYLRASSKKRFSDSETPAGWTVKQPFYDEESEFIEPDFANPTFESIKQKYHLGNFTGCMQEAEAYVKKHPGDTLGYYYLAMSYAKSGEKENAIKAYEKVISLNDNPMIVKYATNGRNCVMQGSETCYPNVNEPDYVYPYAKQATRQKLTPVDPQTLIDKNLAKVENKLGAQAQAAQNDKNPKDPNGKTQDVKAGAANAVKQVFGKQDEELDKFIKAPYGNGLSPQLNDEYRKQKLKQIKENMNKDQSESVDFYNDIKDFDKHKSEAENSLKIASADFSSEDFSKNPEFAQAQKEMKQLDMLFAGSSSKNKNNNDIFDMIPQLLQNGDNVSPQMMQTMIENSLMTNMVDIN